MLLGIIQQVALVPVLLHFWNGEELAAWLVIYAIGNLVLIADCGLQFRAINRFFAFKSGADCDGRTAAFYAAMVRLYVWIAIALVAIVLLSALVVSPSTAFRFEGVTHFNAAFVVMCAGMLLTLPSGLVSALYRARGFMDGSSGCRVLRRSSGRPRNWVAIVATGSLLAHALAFAMQLVSTIYLLVIDAPRLHPYLGKRRASRSRWAG
jgi:hypothetical protein